MMNIIDFVQQKGFYTRAVAINGKKIYSSAHWFNALFVTDLDTKETQLITKFKGRIDAENLYSRAFSYENTIWFIPSVDNEDIAIYDCFSKQIHYLNIGKSDSLYLRYEKTIRDGDVIWLIPSECRTLTKINMREETLCSYSIPDGTCCDKNGFFQISDAILWNKCIYFCPTKGRTSIIFNTESETFEVIDWKYKEDAYRCACICKNELYIIPRNPKLMPIIKCGRRMECVEEIFLDIKENIKSKIGYIGTVQIDSNQISLVSYDEKNILQIDFGRRKAHIISNHEIGRCYQISKIYDENNFTVFSSILNSSPLLIYYKNQPEIVELNISTSAFVDYLSLI